VAAVPGIVSVSDYSAPVAAAPGHSRDIDSASTPWPPGASPLPDLVAVDSSNGGDQDGWMTLVIITTQQPQMALMNHLQLPACAVANTDPLKIATSWLKWWSIEAMPLLGAMIPKSSLKSKLSVVVAMTPQRLPPVAGWSWIRIDNVFRWVRLGKMSQHLGLALRIAVERLSMARGPTSAPDPFKDQREILLGVRELRRLHPIAATPTRDDAALEAFMVERDAAIAELAEEFSRVRDDAYLQSWALRLAATQVHVQVPHEAASLLAIRFSEDALDLPLHPMPKQPRTIARQLPSLPAPSRYPKSKEELLTPEALHEYMTHCKCMVDEIQRMRRLGSSYRRQYTKTLALGESAIREEFRGYVWDLRPEMRLADGRIPPLHPSAPIQSHLNLEWFEKILQDTPNEALRQGLLRGFSYQADPPYQTVSPPHMASLAPGITRVQKELDKMVQHGWAYMGSEPPFLPAFHLSTGTVERKLEPGRPRWIMNFSSPEQPVLDTDNVEVVSLNSRMDIHGMHQQPWGAGPVANPPVPPPNALSPLPWNWRFPREIKPRTAELMNDGVVLRASAQFLGLKLYRAQDDFKSFFWQFWLKSSDYWLQVIIWADADGRLVYYCPYVLAMGAAISSNYCQNIANLIMETVADIFDAQEAFLFTQMQDDPTFAAWLERKARLSLQTGRNEARLFAIRCYTDDPEWMVVGADRMIRFLQTWHYVMQSSGLLMAVADKREIGVSSTWNGHGHISLASLVVLQPHKALRALDVINRAFNEGVTASEWRDNNQLLNHLRVVRMDQPDAMYDMWAVVENVENNCIIPRSILELHKPGITRWIHCLSTIPAASYALAVDQKYILGALPAVPSAVFHVYTDAAKSGTGSPAIAGYVAGLYWALPLSSEALQMFDIPVLEMVGVVIAVYIIAERYPGISISIWSDSETSVTVMHNKANAACMKWLHQELLQSKFYSICSSAGLYVGHISGSANNFADLPSRGRFEELHRLCSAFGISAQRIPLTEAAASIMPRLIAYYAAFCNRSSTSISNAQPFNKAGDGPLANFDLTLPFVVPAAPDVVGSAKRQRLSQCNTTVISLPWQDLPIPKHVVPQLSPTVSLYKPPEVSPEIPVPLLPPPPAPQVATVLSVSSHSTLLPAPNTYSPSYTAFCHSSGILASRDPKLALTPPSDSAFRELMSMMQDALRGSYAASTLRNDKGYWREWSYFCETIIGTSPLRTDLAANLGWDFMGHQREVLLLSLFTVWKIMHMKPRANSSVVANPRSAHNAVSSVRRSHALVTGIEIVRTPQINKIIRGFLRLYVQKFGPDVLLPKRKEPMKMSVVREMITLPTGTRISDSGPYAVIDWSKPFWLAWRACLLTMLSTGFRKNEISLHESDLFTKGRLSRAHIWWHIAGTTYADPDPQILLSFKMGDYVIMKPPISKNDQFCQKFGSKPIYLPFHDSPLCAAIALRDLELHVKVRGPLRVSAPLFALDGHFSPFRHNVIDTIFHNHISVVVGREHASKYSLHSFRIGLACALLKAGRPLPLIQALLRWMSPESLVPYARLDPLEYGRHLIQATSIEVEGVTTLNLPRLDNDDLAINCQSILNIVGPSSSSDEVP